jgi:hypothetical protein
MTCKIAIYCLLLVALIGLVSAAPRKSNFSSTTFVLVLFLKFYFLNRTQNLATGRSQGFKHYCEKRTSGGNTQYLFGYDTVQLPSDWEGSTEESSSTSKDGAVTTHINSWYQLTKETDVKCENLKYL